MPWSAEVFRGELPHEIKNEYRNLLSVNKSDEEAERIVTDYFLHSVSPGSSSEGRGWLSLALAQWTLGRLSETVKEKALFWSRHPNIGLSCETLRMFEETITSPMPQKKKVRLPPWVRSCPWPVGSLLAYKIASNSSVSDSPFWEKYVLLRVVAVKGTPIARLAPEAAHNEYMLVGLYRWWGDSIPKASVADGLDFTPIKITSPLLQRTGKQDYCGMLDSVMSKRVEMLCALDWVCVKGISSKEIFTYLECDPCFSVSEANCYNMQITEYSFSHSIPFDATLVRRLSQLEEESKVP